MVGFQNGEGTNDDKNDYLLKSSSFSKKYEETYKINDSYLTTIPNGCIVDSSFATSSITNTYAYYPFTTDILQIANQMLFDIFYKPVSYSITYNLDGGTNNASNPSSYNVLYSVNLKDPTRAGYKFAGWYDGDTKVTGINEGKNASFTSADDLYTL